MNENKMLSSPIIVFIIYLLLFVFKGGGRQFIVPLVIYYSLIAFYMCRDWGSSLQPRCIGRML